MKEVVDFVERFGVTCQLPEHVINDVNLCLDEILNNLISYGYDDTSQHFISITLLFDGRTLLAELKDDANPFDPRRSPSRPDLQKQNQRGRKIGGLGLQFVNALMDEVDYTQVDGYNRTQLKKTVSSAK